MKRPKSLQRTLGVGLTLGVTLLWVLALVLAMSVLRGRMNSLFDSALAETAQRIMPLAVVEIINSETPEQIQNIMPFAAHDEYFVYLVRDNSGTVLLKSHNADPAIFNQDFHKGFSSSASHRFYGASAVQDSLHIQVAEPLSQRQSAVRDMLMTLVWPLVLLIPLCFFGTWLFVGYSLRHVLAFSEAIKSRGGGDLSAIPHQDLPIEINGIAESLNDLLRRLRRAMELEHAFTANSAHELRTPIATALAQIQRLQNILPSGSSQEQAAKIEQSIKRLSRLSEKLMQLAKAESGLLMSTESHDLIGLLRLIVDEFKRSYPHAVIHLKIPDTETFISNLDADAFAILVQNLLDNALKYGDSHAPLEVSFSAGTLSIVNKAAIIPADQLAQLRRRFVRNNTQVDGSGLGLAIVDAIVTGSGATMTLHSPATHRSDGFEVRISFSH
jgi:Signal transduction histidine kinase